MKKWTKVGMFCGILGIFLMFSGGCASSKESEAGTMPAGGDSAKKTVTVTTTFLMDMTETIAGDTVNIEQIIPAGSDPHLYIAKPQDYDKFSEADLVLYHGLHF